MCVCVCVLTSVSQMYIVYFLPLYGREQDEFVEKKNILSI